MTAELAEGSKRVSPGIWQVGGSASHPKSRRTNQHPNFHRSVTAHNILLFLVPASQRSLGRSLSPVFMVEWNLFINYFVKKNLHLYKLDSSILKSSKLYLTTVQLLLQYRFWSTKSRFIYHKDWVREPTDSHRILPDFGQSVAVWSTRTVGVIIAAEPWCNFESFIL